MIKKMLLASALIFTTWCNPSQASDFKITSLVEDKSLITHVAIPFAARSQSNEVKLNAVNVLSGSNCRTMIDPFKDDNFFVKCLSDGDVTLSIIYTINGVLRTVRYGPFKVLKISDSGKVIDTGDNGPSAEYLLGQDIWNRRSGSYKSCADCHGSASSKAHSISIGSLNSAYTSTKMKSDAIPLTAAEKNAVILYVKSRK